MKNIKKNQCLILLAALITAPVFAASTADLTYDLSNNDQPDAKMPYYYCDMLSDKATISVGPLGTKTIMQIQDATISFKDHVREYTKVSASDLKNKYFEVVKGDMQGKGTVHIQTNNGSELKCDKGKGGRTTAYSE